MATHRFTETSLPSYAESGQTVSREWPQAGNTLHNALVGNDSQRPPAHNLVGKQRNMVLKLETRHLVAFQVLDHRRTVTRPPPSNPTSESTLVAFSRHLLTGCLWPDRDVLARYRHSGRRRTFSEQAESHCYWLQQCQRDVTPTQCIFTQRNLSAPLASPSNSLFESTTSPFAEGQAQSGILLLQGKAVRGKGPSQGTPLRSDGGQDNNIKSLCSSWLDEVRRNGVQPGKPLQTYDVKLLGRILADPAFRVAIGNTQRRRCRRAWAGIYPRAWPAAPTSAPTRRGPPRS